MEENTIKFPMEKVLKPGMFLTKKSFGEHVWFLYKGALVEGRVAGVNATLIPEGEREEGRPVNTSVHSYNYLVEFFVPTENGDYLPQVENIEEKQIFDSLEALTKFFLENAVLRIPEGR